MGSGTLRFEIRTANGDLPVASAEIRIMDISGAVLHQGTSDKGGLVGSVTLNAPDGSLTQDPAYTGPVFGAYDVQIRAVGFRPVDINGVQIFDKVDSVLPVVLHPLTASGVRNQPQVIAIEPNALKDPAPRRSETEPPNPRVLREVIIPDYIRVKLGHPDSHAMVERVPFIDYIKNVIYTNTPNQPETPYL